MFYITSNNQKILDGDIILMDFGAEYFNYASDLTRCAVKWSVYPKTKKCV